MSLSLSLFVPLSFLPSFLSVYFHSVLLPFYVIFRHSFPLFLFLAFCAFQIIFCQCISSSLSLSFCFSFYPYLSSSFSHPFSLSLSLSLSFSLSLSHCIHPTVHMVGPHTRPSAVCFGDCQPQQSGQGDGPPGALRGKCLCWPHDSGGSAAGMHVCVHDLFSTTGAPGFQSSH